MKRYYVLGSVGLLGLSAAGVDPQIAELMLNHAVGRSPGRLSRRRLDQARGGRLAVGTPRAWPGELVAERREHAAPSRLSWRFMLARKRPGIGNLLLPGLNPGISAVTGESDELARDIARLKRHSSVARNNCKNRSQPGTYRGIEQAEEELIEVATSFLGLTERSMAASRECAEFLYFILSDALLVTH